MYMYSTRQTQGITRSRAARVRVRHACDTHAICMGHAWDLHGTRVRFGCDTRAICVRHACAVQLKRAFRRAARQSSTSTCTSPCSRLMRSPNLVQCRRPAMRLNLQEGHSYKDIQKRLAEEGISVTVKSLYLLVAKFRQTNSVVDRPRAAVPKILNEEHYREIDSALSENDELTSRQLCALLTEKHPELSMSLSTVERARRELGWVVTAPKYCQLIREGNKVKRLEWCIKMLETNERFHDVVFTDESSIQLETHRRRCYRRKTAPRKLKPRPKHPLKVHVWGGISKREPTNIVIFTGIMTATRYAQIVEAGLLPFANVYPMGFRFQQDNDPKHCARYTKKFFETSTLLSSSTN